MDTQAADLDLVELRSQRDELRRREGQLSYRRRLLQGQLDIVRGSADGPALLSDLLSDDGAASHASAVRAVDVEALDVDVPGLPDLDALDDASRDALAVRIATEERAVSSERRDVLDRLDVLQEELVRRYRADGVDVTELVGGD